jgi:phosphate transport system substrate-binding protein
MSVKRVIKGVIRICMTAVLMSTSCSRSKGDITMAGSTAFQSFAEKLAARYMNIHPSANISVEGGGSAVGIQSTLSGVAQIGMADLVTLPPEAQKLHSVIVAKDGISIVVHPSNPVGDISMDQIRDIFNGNITNWKELGGPDHPITAVSREAGSGTRTSFEQIVGNVKLFQDAIIQDSNGTIREIVATSPDAIGYISTGIVNSKVKALTVGGIPCNVKQINSGRYKLARPIFLLTLGKPEGEIGDFIGYILSEDGQQIIGKSGLIPLK